MKDKRNEQRKQWAESHPEIQATRSMKRRKAGHDYCSRCIYMITLVTSGRKPLLGKLCGSDSIHNNCWIKTTILGEEIKKEWKKIPQYYPQVKLLALQLMPDHLHGLIFVTEPLPRHLGHLINGFKKGCNDAWKQLRRELCEADARNTPTSTTLDGNDNMWEWGYHDRILIHKSQLDTMFKYLRDNPRRLWVKRSNPHLFTAINGMKIGETPVTALGNQFLLDYPIKIQVQCSRSMSENEIEEKCNLLLSQACYSDAVLVSPCISPGEKEIMRRALDAGFPQIILLENGISSMQKPSGRQFDACAEGRLLLLSPWEHHNDHHAITREQCLQLNTLAEIICK
ncbi:MAG: hypothetical protein IKX31_09830 [Muribaculaceae bacterium]|nr:hypothetical protein [Muribaculaceae bacterium]